jgi:hypothetical protein
MMSEDQFWNLIVEARASTKENKEIPAWLEQRLLELPANDIIDFSTWLATFAGRSHNAKLWAAASIIANGLSYDGFFGFQGWLIAQGKATYEKALGNPDSLADIEIPGSGTFGLSVSLEELFYVYFWAYNKKAGKPRYATVELPPGYQPPPGSEPSPPAGVTMKTIHEKVQGELAAWLRDPAKLAAAFPKLVRRFKLP